MIGNDAYNRFLVVSTSYGQGVTSGSLRIENGILEAYTGYSWVPADTSYTTVSLTPMTTRILEWAEQKMQEEILEKTLHEKYPALKSAKGQYEMIKQICQSEEKLNEN